MLPYDKKILIGIKYCFGISMHGLAEAGKSIFNENFPRERKWI